MRALALSVGAILLFALAACSGGSEEVVPTSSVGGSSSPTPAGSAGPVPTPEFIDSEPVIGEGIVDYSNPGLAVIIGSRSEAVAVIEVIEIVDVVNAGPSELPVTLYRAKVEEWIKGGGELEVIISGEGGITDDGSRFLDGHFLMATGRRYVVVLEPSPAELAYKPYDYTWPLSGLANFEVTDGFVHVLNNPIAYKLEEEYGGMPLDEFIEILKDFVANPRTATPRPTPAPTPDHVDSVQGDPSLVIDRMAIDVGAADLVANTATSLGALQRCALTSVGDTLIADLTLDAVPAQDGIEGFQFELRYDPGILRIVDADFEMLLAANDGSSLVPFGESVPDEDGVFLVGVADFGEESAPDTGSGVLARITFEAVGAGVSPLTLTGVIVSDANQKEFTINEVFPADVAVGAPCPPGS